MADDRELLKKYYQKELSYLKSGGEFFAKHYPKIAKRLKIFGEEIKDPHVERLIESVAFLTARLHKTIDSSHHRFTKSMMEILYPYFTHPLPPCGMVKFSPLAENIQEQGFVIKKGQTFYCKKQNFSVPFKNTYPVHLWPLEIIDTKLVKYEDGKKYIRCSIKSTQGNLAELKINSLRFYIQGIMGNKAKLYDAIFSSTEESFIRSDDKLMQHKTKVLSVGFDPDERLFNFSSFSDSSYSLILEYFYFAEKFFYFDLDKIDLSNFNGTVFHAYIPIHSRGALSANDVTSKVFSLFVSPVINLDSCLSESIIIDGKKNKYNIKIDPYREKFIDIHSISKVYHLNTVGDTVKQEIPNYFHIKNLFLEEQPSLFWIPHYNSYNLDKNKRDVEISFVDSNFNPKQQLRKIFFCELQVSNLLLSSQIHANDLLEPDNYSPVENVSFLSSPRFNFFSENTLPKDAISLISLLNSTNFNSLTAEDETTLIRDFLYLFQLKANDSSKNEVNAIEKIDREIVTRKISYIDKVGHVVGTKMTISFNDLGYTSDGSFLLGNILQKVFLEKLSINTFLEFEIKDINYQGLWKKWKAQAGNRRIL